MAVTWCRLGPDVVKYMCAELISIDSLAVGPLGLPDLGDLLLHGQFSSWVVQPSASLIVPQLTEFGSFGGLVQVCLQAVNEND